jgi:hypothetical protein
MLEQKPNSEQKAETLDSSSPNSINTHVSGLPLSKWELFGKFSEELQPIIKDLNDLLHKYGVYPLDNFILFNVPKTENNFVPFLNYEAFPVAKFEDK